MKTHYCKAEGVPISFKGECNWCGMKETHGFEGWYEDNEKHIDPRDMKAWLATAWDAAIDHAVDACEAYDFNVQGLIRTIKGLK